MNTSIKIIVIILFIVISVSLGILAYIHYRNVNYYKFTETSGRLEKKYTALGKERVAYKEYRTEDEAVKKYTFWYPVNMKNTESKYPVVIFANGTSLKSSVYKTFFTHLASWGFIVAGNDDQSTRTGDSLEKTLKFIIRENKNSGSIFYNKIDLDNIGLGGHSQGGVGVINMVVNQEHGSMVKTIYGVSTTSSYYTGMFKDGWEYDISKVNIPVLLTAGTGFFEAGTASNKEEISDEKNKIIQGTTPLWSLEENFNLLPDRNDKVIVRKTGIDHIDSHLQFDGYMTAWFRYYLMNDEEAGKVFYGEAPELAENPKYQNVSINRGE